MTEVTARSKPTHRRQPHLGLRGPSMPIDVFSEHHFRVGEVEGGCEEGSGERSEEGQCSLDGCPALVLLENDRDGAEQQVENTV